MPQTNGNDLLFTAGDGTNKLAHEIESYTNASGTLVSWVKVPFLTSTADTNLYLYYGNAAATDQQNVGGVWDTNYKRVWHLNQTPAGSAGDMADSNNNNNDGTSQTIAASAKDSGRIGGSLTFDGASDYISMSVSITNNPATITEEAWVKTTSTSGTKVVGLEGSQTGTGSTSYERHIFIGTDGKARFGVWNASTGSTNMVISANPVNDGQWHFLVGCRDNAASTVSLYVDGVLQGTAASSAGQTYTGWYRIGSFLMYAPIWQFSASGYFNGSVDEARVSHVARSSAWIATEYNNQSSPSTFYDLCSTESQPPTKLVITSVNGGTNATYGTSFSVVVQVQDANGNAANVVTNTAVTLSLNAGSGTLGGTLTGTITNGASSITFSGITYNKAQSGIVFTVTRTSGDSLTAGNSSSFTMNSAPVIIASGLSANNKTYDGTTTATPAGAAALQSAEAAGSGTTADGKPYSVDSVSLTGAAAYNFNSKDVGSATTVTESGLSLTGTGNGNYTLTAPVLTAGITAASTTLILASSALTNAHWASLAFTATVQTGGVTDTGAGGTVQFVTNTVNFGGAVGLSSGTVSTDLATLPRGTNSIFAVYSGNGNYSGSTSSTLTEVVTNNLPVAAAFNVSRTAGLDLLIFLSDLTNSWSDIDGDPVTWAGLNLLTTNGVTVRTNSVLILYCNSNNVNDQISYSINDGHGGTGAGIIKITVNPFVSGQQSATPLTVSGGMVTTVFFGIPDYTYEVQRSTNLVSGTGWVNILTNTVSTNGVFSLADHFTDLGGILPSAAYYRLEWHP